VAWLTVSCGCGLTLDSGLQYNAVIEQALKEADAQGVCGAGRSFLVFFALISF
jgi:hypothetical protein